MRIVKDEMSKRPEYTGEGQSCFHMKAFALRLALKQRRKAARKSPIEVEAFVTCYVTSRRGHIYNYRLIYLCCYTGKV